MEYLGANPTKTVKGSECRKLQNADEEVKENLSK